MQMNTFSNIYVVKGILCWYKNLFVSKAKTHANETKKKFEAVKS